MTKATPTSPLKANGKPNGKTARASQANPRQTIRTQLLLLTIAPLFTLSLALGALAVSQQAQGQRSALISGGIQVGQVLAQTTQTQLDNTGLRIDQEAAASEVQNSLERLFESKALPVAFAAAVNQDVQIVAAVSDATTGEQVSEIALAKPIKAFEDSETDFILPMQQLARQALNQAESQTDAPTATVSAGGKERLLIAYPLPNRNGAITIALDTKGIGAAVTAYILGSALVVIPIVGLVGFLATLAAGRIVARLVNLSTSATRASTEDANIAISDTGNDEITTLAEAIDRLRVSVVIAMESLE